MNKIYLLLRDNKQTGPHSIEELVQLSLKPTDLIWVEGRSAGWRNPMEIDSLKSYVPGFSEPVVTRESMPVVEKTGSLSQPSASTPAKENAIQKQSKNIFVSLPAGLQIYDTIQRPDEAEIPDEVEIHEEPVAENLGKKAQELLNRVQAYSQEKSLAKIDSDKDVKHTLPFNDIKEEYPSSREQQETANTGSGKTDLKESGIDNKYTRSLNDIKEEYTNWRKQPKIETKKRVIGKKPLIAAAVLACVIALSVLWNSFNGKITAWPVENNASSIPVAKESEQMPVEKDEPLSVQKDDLPDADFFADQMNKDQVKITEEISVPVVNANTEVDAPVRESIQINPGTNENKIAVINKKDNEGPEASTSKAEKKEDKIAVINKKEEATVKTSTSEPQIKKEKPSVPLTELINIDGDYLPSQKGDGVNGYKVTMQNNSDQVLKVVAVDVFYYGPNDKLLNKKTLYFSNVSPGANMILTAPSNKYAVAVNHQLGLVSSQEGAIFFVKQ
jgi:hypothetical protein